MGLPRHVFIYIYICTQLEPNANGERTIKVLKGSGISRAWGWALTVFTGLGLSVKVLEA